MIMIMTMFIVMMISTHSEVILLEGEGEAHHRVHGSVRVVGQAEHRHWVARGEGGGPGTGHHPHRGLVDVPVFMKYYCQCFKNIFHDNKQIFVFIFEANGMKIANHSV